MDVEAKNTHVDSVDLRFGTRENDFMPKPPKLEDLKMPVNSLLNNNQMYAKFSHNYVLKLKKYTSYGNGLLDAIMTAYNFHLNLHLTPDDILLAVDDIVSKFVATASVKYRNKFRHKNC